MPLGVPKSAWGEPGNRRDHDEARAGAAAAGRRGDSSDGGTSDRSVVSNTSPGPGPAAPEGRRTGEAAALPGREPTPVRLVVVPPPVAVAASWRMCSSPRVQGGMTWRGEMTKIRWLDKGCAVIQRGAGEGLHRE
jgi:hypothetical protein